MRVERRSGELGVRADGTLEIPTTLGVRDLPDEVVLGVRPEHTHLWRENTGLVGPIEGRARYVEMLGRETFIGMDTAGAARFTVLGGPDVAVRPDERVPFGLERGRLYLFDPETKLAIARV
jgi:TOBE domain